MSGLFDDVPVFDELMGQKETHFLNKYFPTGEVEYPDPSATMLELGLWHTYLSSTFLNGWINYVKPIAGSILTRYRAHSKNVEMAARFHDPDDQEFKFHTRISLLGDDVLILGRSPSKADPNEEDFVYWVFWFDCDVSDCCIGRFKTTVPEEQLIREFHEWMNELSLELSKDYSNNDGCAENREGCPAIQLDPDRFKGWVGF